MIDVISWWLIGSCSVDLFPLKLTPVLSLLSRRTETDQQLTDLLQRFNSSSLGIMDPIQLVKRAIPGNLPIKVTEIMPRLKDGGAFVKFEFDPSLSTSEIEGKLKFRLQSEVMMVTLTVG